jgi:Raf kinase inhibitor-like YbhB/YbcL family protein
MDIGHAVKCVTTGMPAMVTGGQPGCRAGNERLAFAQPELNAEVTLAVQSTAIRPEGEMPVKYSVDGDAISPPLTWGDIPPAARSLALVVEDPDAPTPNPFVHWLVYNIPVTLRAIPENIPHDEIVIALSGAMQGKNSGLKVGWTGMAPPKGDTPHHYHFQLFALDRVLDVKPGAGRTALFDAMGGHVLARGELVGTYKR